MKKILLLLNEYTPRYDRLAHFFWGSIYSILGAFIGYIIYFNLFIILVPFILGLIKEVYDWRKFDFIDWFYTFLPGVIIYLLKIM